MMEMMNFINMIL